MHDQEPSYYEIALTNRQVVVAFVILLLCLLGTFFAGVWVGRGEVRAAHPVSAERTADAGDGIEELDFFGDGEGAETTEEVQPAEPAPPRDDAVERRVEIDPGAEAERRPPRRPPAESSGQQAAARETPPAPEPAAPQPSEPSEPAAESARGEGSVIQVFSSRDREQAERLVERLVDGGQDAFLSPVDVDGQTMYRVRIGPFPNRERAEAVADRVRREYRLDTWITQ